MEQEKVLMFDLNNVIVVKRILAYFGSALLIIGCFLPILSTPDKTYNFFDTIPFDIPGISPHSLQFAGIAIILISITSMILAFISNTKFIWMAGIASVIVMTCVHFFFNAKLNEMKEQDNKQLDNFLGGMFKGVTDVLFQNVQIGGTGWHVIGLGALLLFFSSLNFKRK